MFSILTPTYNRAKELNRVYNSLIDQSFREFEWIISDDGSTDETAIIVKKWQNEGLDFKITYHVLSHNQGKSYAVNEGLDLCNHPYTIIADSDDTFFANTLEDLKTIWDSIELTDNAEKIGAVWTLVQDEASKLVGELYPKNFWLVNFKERVLERKRPVVGEKWHSWRTEVLQHYKMYTNENSHIGPGVTWNIINKDYDFLCVNIIHRTYWYTSDGIIHQSKTKLKIAKRSYYGVFLSLQKTTISETLKYRYYRNQAFEYVKASFIYKDKNLKFSGFKLFMLWVIFIWVLPFKIFNKLF